MAHLDNKPQYSMTQFNAVFDRLVTFFRAKISREISEMYFSRLRIYPIEAVEKAIDDHISAYKPMGGNFPPPHDLVNACDNWLKERPDVRHSITIYDRIDDDEYPLDFLFDGFSVLVKHGRESFMKYAHDQRMPDKDKQRVIDKWRYSNDPAYKAWVKEAAKKVRSSMSNFANMDEIPF